MPLVGQAYNSLWLENLRGACPFLHHMPISLAEQQFLNMGRDRQLWQILQAITGAQPNYQFLPAVTGYTGGGSTNLDGQTTIGIPTGFTVAFNITGVGQKTFELTAGTAATDNTNHTTIRGLDYNATTNAKYWLMIT